MSSDLISYNGYNFNSYSNISISAVAQDDDAGRTTLYHRWRLRVETTIYAGEGETGGQAGIHFRRIRDRLSKKGQALTIYHQGFDDGLFEVNVNDTGARDVTFGPHPRVITWEPEGHENAVKVVWECEFCISACNRWKGIMSVNYGISTRIDHAGYTTRTVSGYLEIAMTRKADKSLPDTADAYRDDIVLGRLPNFHREHTWNLSADKRRADFTIVDTQIRSPNAYPPGVISISGNHTAMYSRHSTSKLPQAIRVSIELAQGKPKSIAWEIFKAIVEKRTSNLNTTIMFENLAVDEDLFGNTIQFSIGYRTIVDHNMSIVEVIRTLFARSKIGESLNLGTWENWKSSIESLQSHRGQANLKHKPEDDQIIDLCSTEYGQNEPDTARVPYTPGPNPVRSIVNPKPSPRKSYLVFDTWMETDEEVPTTIQISVAPDDLDSAGNKFDPKNPEATLGSKVSGAAVSRFVETQSGKIEVVWKGYAERIGYPIPRPDKLVIGGVTLRRVGKARFAQKFLGNAMGQPVYAAAWNQRYIVSERPEKMDTENLDEWEMK